MRRSVAIAGFLALFFAWISAGPRPASTGGLTAQLTSAASSSKPSSAAAAASSAAALKFRQAPTIDSAKAAEEPAESAEGEAPLAEEPAAEEPTEEAQAIEEELPEALAPSDVDFWDMEEDAWYVPYIQTVVAWGLADGYRDGDGELTGFFGPGNRVTVAELLKMAMNGALLNLEDCSAPSMPGAGEHWAAIYVGCAEDRDMRIIRKRVDLNRPILRGEAVGLIHDVFGVEAPPVQSPFKDTKGNLYENDIAYDAARQIVAGVADWRGNPTGEFKPNTTLTRAEAAKIMFLTIHTDSQSNAEVMHPVSLDITSKNYAFSPSTIVVYKGQVVTVRFKNTGIHNFNIDELNIHKTLSDGEETLTFIPTEVGTFPFYCEMPGHKQAGMVGYLRVQ